MIRSNGFTLIEVLISTIVLSFITIGIVSVTGNSVNTRDRVVTSDREYLQVEMALSKLEQDLTAIYSPLYFDKLASEDSDLTNPGGTASGAPQTISRFEGRERFISETVKGFPIPRIISSDKQTLEFMIFNNKRRISETKESQFAFVRYTIKKPEKNRNNSTNSSNSSKELFDLVRGYDASDPYKLEKIDWDKVKSYTLLSNLSELSFQFWDVKKEKFVDSMSDFEEEKNIVRAIKIKFTWYDQGGTENKEERIFRSLWPYFVEKKTSEESYNPDILPTRMGE